MCRDVCASRYFFFFFRVFFFFFQSKNTNKICTYNSSLIYLFVETVYQIDYNIWILNAEFQVRNFCVMFATTKNLFFYFIFFKFYWGVGSGFPFSNNSLAFILINVTFVENSKVELNTHADTVHDYSHWLIQWNSRDATQDLLHIFSRKSFKPKVVVFFFL